MNKTYLVSLVGYLAINTTLFVVLSLIMSQPITFSGFLFTTTIGILVHKLLVYNKR